MRKSTLAIAGAAIGILFSSGLFAEEDLSALFDDTAAADTASAGTAPSDSAASAFTLKLSGEHTFGYHAPAYWPDTNQNYGGSIKAPSFLNDVGVEVKDGSVKLVSRWGFDINPTTTGSSVTPYENYVSWSPSVLKLAFGYQVFSWGVADRKNPTDNLNPKDYTVGVNPDKLAVLAGDMVWYPTDSISVEAVAIPYKQDSEFPVDFAEEVQAKALAAQKLFAPSQTVTTSYRNTANPEDIVAGGKLNFNSANVDLSLDYLYDLDQYYTPKISIAATGLPAGYPQYKITSISLERRRIQRFGGDAKTTIGKFGLWLEGAYSLTENDGSDDYSVRKSKLDYTLGSDVSFGPNDTWYLNFQYFGSWIPGYDEDFNATEDASMIYSTYASALEYCQRATVNSLGLETEGLLQGLTCNLKAELADALFTPQVTAVYAMPFQYDTTDETRYGALVLNPELDMKPVDSFHIKVGADLYYAWHKIKGRDNISLDTTTNAIGTYTTSNNVYLKVVYKWNTDIKK